MNWIENWPRQFQKPGWFRGKIFGTLKEWRKSIYWKNMLYLNAVICLMSHWWNFRIQAMPENCYISTCWRMMLQDKRRHLILTSLKYFSFMLYNLEKYFLKQICLQIVQLYAKCEKFTCTNVLYYNNVKSWLCSILI